jgi:hypothetical protein
LDPAIFYPTAPPGLQQSPEYQEGYRQGMRKGFFSGLIVIGFLSNPWDEVADRIIEHFTGWPFGFPTPSDLADIPRKGLEKVGRDAVEKGAREGAETVTEKCPVTLKHFLEGDDVAEAGRHAQDVGEVTGIVDRAGKDARRAANLKGKPKVPGKDLDEYPPAVIKPDDPSVTSVRPIDRSHNRRSGARLRSELPPDGTRVRIIPPAKSS